MRCTLVTRQPGPMDTSQFVGIAWGTLHKPHLPRWLFASRQIPPGCASMGKAQEKSIDHPTVPEHHGQELGKMTMGKWLQI